MDMSATVVPKSDQMNADDLISGPRTITIARVVGCAGEQPVAVHFEGDAGKPYKPCKSMRRVMIAAWGPDAAQYAGRRMTLYCDPEVAFGGMKVGGIRISHMSHIEREMVMALTVTKAKRAPYSVKPLAKDNAAVAAAEIVARVEAAATLDALKEITGAETVVKQRAWMAEKRPDLAETINNAVAAAVARLGQPAGQE